MRAPRRVRGNQEKNWSFAVCLKSVTSWFLNAKIMGTQLCYLTEIIYFAIFKCKVEYVFIGKITIPHIPSAKGTVLMQSITIRSIFD